MVGKTARRTCIENIGLMLIWVLAGASAQAQQPLMERLDEARLEQAARQLPRLQSLLISQHGELEYEQYYGGRNASQAANMKSASKSVISALIGIAIRKGLLADEQQNIGPYFPDYLDEPDKQAITIANLLTMQSGLQSTSNRNYGSWVLSDDWVASALAQPLVAEPGRAMLYSTGSTHILSALITRVAGMSTKAFAQENLADPLGINLAYWSQDPQGIYFGGNDLEMTPRAMLAFGQLYLDDGVHEGQRILPEGWVEKSFTPHAESPRGQGRYYGYGWWLREMAGELVPVAWGYGGQLIFVLADLQMVVVATSVSTPGEGRRGHLGRLYDLVEREILLPLQ